MIDFVSISDLFCNEYRAVILCEYAREMTMLRRLIEIADECIFACEPRNAWCYEGVCHMFAKSIVEHAKMAYDNMQIGHFDAVNMILRAIIENTVCFEIIEKDEKDELWKYYLVQSYRDTVIKPKEVSSLTEKTAIEHLYKSYSIEEDFYKKRIRKKAYIDVNYGWSYKVNKTFSFKGMCAILDDEGEYKGFSLMSAYSHGTSLHAKLGGSVSMDHIMSMIASLYIGLYRLLTKYCMELLPEEFFDIAEEIENSIFAYINKWDETECI